MNNKNELIKGFSYDLSSFFEDLGGISKPLLLNAKKTFSKIEEMLYTSPVFIELITSSVPKETLQAVFTAEDQMKLATGALKLMTKSDGTLMANLVGEGGKIVKTVPLKNVVSSPQLGQAMTNYALQMQMVQISEQLKEMQKSVEEIKKGQENDRLAEAYSCQQKYIQACSIKDEQLKREALMRIAHSAEDSRNLLMLSQKENLEFIKSQPEKFFMKVVEGASAKDINGRVNDIKKSLTAINTVSFIEAASYQEMGENEAAGLSLKYYSDYVQDNYFADSAFIDRLDSIDESPLLYWSNALPKINDSIKALPYYGEGE